MGRFVFVFITENMHCMWNEGLYSYNETIQYSCTNHISLCFGDGLLWNQLIHTVRVHTSITKLVSSVEFPIKKQRKYTNNIAFIYLILDNCHVSSYINCRQAAGDLLNSP